MEFQSQIANKTNEELLEIYSSPGEYNPQFIQLAVEELHRRNVPMDKYQEEKEQKINASNQSMVKDKKGDDAIIVLGFILSVLGGVLGIVIGCWYLQKGRNKVTGETYAVYDKRTRVAGSVMIVISVVMMFGYSIWKFS